MLILTQITRFKMEDSCLAAIIVLNILTVMFFIRKATFSTIDLKEGSSVEVINNSFMAYDQKQNANATE